MLGAEGTARAKAKGSQGPVGWKAGGASEELRWPGGGSWGHRGPWSHSKGFCAQKSRAQSPWGADPAQSEPSLSERWQVDPMLDGSRTLSSERRVGI